MGLRSGETKTRLRIERNRKKEAAVAGKAKEYHEQTRRNSICAEDIEVQQGIAAASRSRSID